MKTSASLSIVLSMLVAGYVGCSSDPAPTPVTNTDSGVLDTDAGGTQDSGNPIVDSGIAFDAAANGQLLCDKISARAAKCLDAGSTTTLESCNKNAASYACLFVPQFAALYADCRGNLDCSVSAGDDFCVFTAARAIAPTDFDNCLAYAKACADAGTDPKVLAESCAYVATTATIRASFKACYDKPTCGEAATCLKANTSTEACKN